MSFNICDMLTVTAASGENAIVTVGVDELVPYRNHKFRLYEGERLDDMVQSIAKNGVLMPLIVRPADTDGKYEILAGHNRHNAARLAGVAAVPCIVKNGLTDDEAEMYVIETNLIQRGFNDLSVTEQAAVVALRHSKMFSDEKAAAIREELRNIQNGGKEDVSESAVYVSENGKSKLAAVGSEYGLSKNSVARLIRINTLTEDLKRSVDLDVMPVRAGVELSYISQSAQEAVYQYYGVTVVKGDTEYKAAKVDMKTAATLRGLFAEFDGSAETALKMIESYFMGAEDKPKKPRARKLDATVYTKYFDEDESDEYINDIIDQALQMYFDKEQSA